MENQKIKVLVVEDEVLLLKNLAKKIRMISEQFEVTGEAYNGKEALALIQEEKPDIVFSDIRMPIMDGLELARILHQDFPEIITVVVSGYDDFEYARSMLSYRARDYLLKPVKSDVLEKLMLSLKKEITEERNKKIRSILETCLKREAKEEVLLPNVNLYLVCFGNLHFRREVEAEGEHPVPELGLPEEFLVLPYRESNLRILAGFGENGGEETAGRIFGMLKQEYPQKTINLVWGEHGVCGSQIFEQADRLYRILYDNLLIGKSQVFTESEESPKPILLLSGKESQYLQTTLASGNIAGFGQAVQKLFSQWNQENYSQKQIEKLLRQLLTLVGQNLSQPTDRYEEVEHQVFQSLIRETDIQKMADEITSVLTGFLAENQAVPKETEQVVEALDAYLRSHYTEPVSLSELAEKYHFNQSYLTRIFKKQKGESPLRLVNQLRIADAKELLLQEELSVKEISEMLGFSDQHYFSRIFKDFTGQNPKEYRNSLTDHQSP